MTPDSAGDTYDISGIELSDERYTVEQSLVRNKYRAENSAGETVLQGAQKLFRAREEFPFTDGQGTDVFTVKAGGIIDIAGNYTLTDATTGEELVVLDNDYSIFRDVWTIRDADSGEVLATISSRGALVTLLRRTLPFGNIIPHKYSIEAPDGTAVGAIDGQLSVRDRYEVRLDRDAPVPREPVLAAAMVIDAIQGN
ncbi:MAG: LURP-one-related/scramblase family protein [Halobacteriaceae archaeon]